ncbi:hypothetical protein HELRODRAFT_176022 [Helobdella robusta]|uniref:Uncharacterized protein n=1 Tax=Helobdella robusta TaxID=6412 RepID=T1FA12_HELRO|nr:hypothetical protein HELRODRAFT_176022 [Helobdella robusta]ESO00188.1 hypothetical protein HELRODRAFT_176022 [Helobdella robusta]
MFQTPSINDPTYPKSFDGNHQDALTWWQYFENWLTFKHWLPSNDANIQSQYYVDNMKTIVALLSLLFKDVDKNDYNYFGALIGGLRDDIRRDITIMKPTNIDELYEAARLVENNCLHNSHDNEIANTLMRLEESINNIKVARVDDNKYKLRSRERDDYDYDKDRRSNHYNDEKSRNRSDSRPSSIRSRSSRSRSNSPRDSNRQQQFIPRNKSNERRVRYYEPVKQLTLYKCNNCGTEHTSGKCPAYNKQCFRCNKITR